MHITHIQLFQTTKIQTFESNSQQSDYNVLGKKVVSDYKDTNFWKQFTTPYTFGANIISLFQTTKIQTFESNSQQRDMKQSNLFCCFRLQRYKFLKAIHNRCAIFVFQLNVVSDHKDTNFWKQFTTIVLRSCTFRLLFQTTKIQTFESNSQPAICFSSGPPSCFRLQRYKLLKAIHNACTLGYFVLRVVSDYENTNFWKQFTTRIWTAKTAQKLFQTTKIQTFESNSQPCSICRAASPCCFRLQRYILLKAIHNAFWAICCARVVVSDYKDTNFWKQFTTSMYAVCTSKLLFQTTKIQTFESNSQQRSRYNGRICRCFRLQRYKLLKAIHNAAGWQHHVALVVSDCKYTNFWKQFTTIYQKRLRLVSCFRLLPIQIKR